MKSKTTSIKTFKTLKDLIPISEQLYRYTPEELRDPYVIVALYAMFGVDEILFSADPHSIPERVGESIKDVFDEYKREKPNLRSAQIKLHAAVDSIECALGPREGGNEGDALKRLRRFEDEIAARRKGEKS